MRTQLLCTFATTNTLTKTVDNIINTYDVLYNKIFVLHDTQDRRELMCTYNIEPNVDITIIPNTISLHRKKHTNTLYTINALNAVIMLANNGVLDKTFMLDWQNYADSILLTSEGGYRQVNTGVKEIIYIRTKLK